MSRALPFCLSLLGLMAVLVSCNAAATTNQLPAAQIVTVVVSSTAAPSATPLILTEVQTVVVTATPVPTDTARAAAQAQPSPTPWQPSATHPAATATFRMAQGFKYAAPTLLAPASGITFAGAPPILEWEGSALDEDEYFEVTIERIWQNQPYYAGSDWTRETFLVVPDFVRGSSDTYHYTWWVTIKRQLGTNAAGGRMGEALSPPSEQRTFTWPVE